MKASGPRAEHETIVSWNDVDPFAQIYTASDIIDRRCHKAGLVLTEVGERHNVYTCPKAAIRIRKQIQSKPMSETRKAALVERMAIARQNIQK